MGEIWQLCVLKVDVWEAASKDLSDLNKGLTVTVDSWISKAAAIVGWCQSAVISIHQKRSKEGQLVMKLQAGQRASTDPCSLPKLITVSTWTSDLDRGLMEEGGLVWLIVFPRTSCACCLLKEELVPGWAVGRGQVWCFAQGTAGTPCLFKGFKCHTSENVFPGETLHQWLIWGENASHRCWLGHQK